MAVKFDLSAEQVYAFRHAVLADAAYQLLLPSARSELHALALAILEAVLDSAAQATLALELADHARRVIQAPGRNTREFARKELGYLHTACKTAEAGFRNEEAAQVLARIIDHRLATAKERAGALAARSRLLYFLGRPQEARDAILRSVDLSRKYATPAELVMRLTQQGDLLHNLGQIEHAEMSLMKAIRNGESAAPAEAEMARLQFARLLGATSRAEAGLAEAATAHARLTLIGTPRQRMQACFTYGTALSESGNLAAAEKHLRAALELARASANPRPSASILFALGELLMGAGRPDEAESALIEALELHQRTGSRPDEANTRALLAVLYAKTNRTHLVEGALLEALPVLEEAGDFGGLGRTIGNLGSLYAETGQFARAFAAAERAATCFSRAGERVMYGISQSNIAQLAMMCLDFERAESALARTLEAIPADGYGPFRVQYALVLCARLAASRSLLGEDSRLALEQAEAAIAEADVILLALAMGEDTYSGKALADARAAIKAVREALAKGKQHPLFGGHQPHEYKPEARLALMECCASLQPARFSILSRNEALMSAMRAGTAGVAVPDWRKDR